MITTRRYEAEIPVAEYFEKYVNIEEFEAKCKECPGYGKKWSCPPFEFKVEDAWKKYNTLFLLAMKVTPDAKYKDQTFEKEELDKIVKETLNKAKELLAGELYVWEQKIPGSYALSAGSCIYCEGECARVSGQPCRNSSKMRYSLEALGANVGKSVTDLIGLDLQWVEEGKLPEYFVAVAGLLY